MKLSDIQEGTIITEEIEKQLEPSQAQKTTETEAPRHVTRVINKDAKKKRVEREILKSDTETRKFQITPAMLKWVDTAVELITDAPATISAKCNVSRVSWYRWCNTLEGFEDWFYDEYKARRRRWLPKLDTMGMQRASKSFDYWKAMNQKAGDLLDDTRNVGVTGQQVVAILGGMTINNIKQDTKENKEDT